MMLESIHARIDQALRKIEELEAKVHQFENAVVYAQTVALHMTMHGCRAEEMIKILGWDDDEVEKRIANRYPPKKFDPDEHYLL